jgi:hypothetical protein
LFFDEGAEDAGFGGGEGRHGGKAEFRMQNAELRIEERKVYPRMATKESEGTRKKRGFFGQD